MESIGFESRASLRMNEGLQIGQADKNLVSKLFLIRKLDTLD
jgi:hypothetical protein